MHLEQLGSYARPSGGPGASKARRYCANVLTAAGFSIREHSFGYSAFPASWAMPLAGLIAALGASTIYLGRWLHDLIGVGVIGLVIGFAALASLGRRGVLDFPFMRRRGINLEATRGETEPRVWLVAHIDSKWQPVSTLTRVVSIVGTSLGLLATLALALTPRSSNALAMAVLVLTWILAVPLMLSVIGHRNHGTLDNASGVATVLEAAEQLPHEVRVGVLITDAEELALAGARAWARTRPASIALNCDGVDDEGPLVLMYSSPRPEALIQRFERAAESEEMGVRRLIPGVLTDSVALAAAGWETLTLSRGRLRTLRRIHTSRDTLANMRGTGIPGAARVLANVATELG